MLAWLLATDSIAVRALAAAALCFTVGVAFGGRMVGWLSARFREPNRSPSPYLEQLHSGKDRTPTMGGLFLVLAILASAASWADLENPFVLVTLFTLAGLSVIGVIDDLAKLSRRAKGISAQTKFLAQCLVAGVAALALYELHRHSPGGLDLPIPFTAHGIDLGMLFIPLAMFVIVGSCNAVNLTDGLDGLASGCLVFAAAAIGAVVYIAGQREWADYFGVLYVAGSAEMVVLAGGMIGGLLAFLRFNRHPARVFMGDAGSLPLGGMLAMLALVARQELALATIGGVFVAEAASVIVQVGYFKWRRRRILLCAPLHHHFQFLGWPESRIVARFWIAAALCAILGLASLKFSSGKNQHEAGPVASHEDRMEGDER